MVEGVLCWAEGEERTRAECLKAEIADARAGDLPITLIIEDPTGNSAIVSDRAIQEPFACNPRRIEFSSPALLDEKPAEADAGFGRAPAHDLRPWHLARHRVGLVLGYDHREAHAHVEGPVHLARRDAALLLEPGEDRRHRDRVVDREPEPGQPGRGSEARRR